MTALLDELAPERVLTRGERIRLPVEQHRTRLAGQRQQLRAGGGGLDAGGRAAQAGGERLELAALSPWQQVLRLLPVYGLPIRMPHGSFGVRYIHQLVRQSMGHSKIFEVMFPGDPCRAFLMDGNSLAENTLVTAHVIGHARIREARQPGGNRITACVELRVGQGQVVARQTVGTTTAGAADRDPARIARDGTAGDGRG